MTDAVSECMHQANKPEIILNHRLPQEMLVSDSRISVSEYFNVNEWIEAR